jgi:hypothetical protein
VLLDRDPALALEVHRVEELLVICVAERSRALEQAVAERPAVVDVAMIEKLRMRCCMGTPATPLREPAVITTVEARALKKMPRPFSSTATPGRGGAAGRRARQPRIRLELPRRRRRRDPTCRSPPRAGTRPPRPRRRRSSPRRLQRRGAEQRLVPEQSAQAVGGPGRRSPGRPPSVEHRRIRPLAEARSESHPPHPVAAGLDLEHQGPVARGTDYSAGRYCFERHTLR